MMENKTKNAGGMRRLRMGGYSMILIVAVIAAAVIVNMIVATLPSRYTAIDLSNTGVYDISDVSVSHLRALEDEVTIYIVTTDDGKDLMLDNFLDRYKDYTKKLTVVTIDPELDPAFVSEHGVGSLNSVVVKSDKRSKTIDYLEIYKYSEEQQREYYQSYLYYSSGFASIEESGIAPELFDADNEIMSAIDYVTTDVLPTVYFTTGHGESALPNIISQYISSENVTTAELNLLAAGNVPDDADIVVINAPATDITDAEAVALTSFIDDGGKVIAVTDVSSYSTESMPNITRIAAHCGLRAIDGVVLEEDTDRYVNGNQFVLIEPLESCVITSTVPNPSSYGLVLGRPHAIVKNEEYDGAMTVSPILKTTNTAYIIGADEELRGRADGDETGEFYIGAISQDAESGAIFIWYSTSYINNELTTYNYNPAVFVLTVTSVCEKPATLSIESANIGTDNLLITESNANILTALILLVIPAGVLITGVIIWIRRRLR